MPVVVTSWSGSVVSTKNQLIDKVAALYGFPSTDDDYRNRVLTWLDDSINDLNHNTWESTRIAESAITLTAAQQYVTLSSLVFKESQIYLVHNTDGAQAPLRVLPWVHFKRLYWTTQDSGRPFISSVFNMERDARFYFYPTPDTPTATNYTLTVEYYQRLPKISLLGDNDSPEMPSEFESTLLYGAYKRAAMAVGQPQDVTLYAGLESESIRKLKSVDSTLPDADRRFRLYDEQPLSRYLGRDNVVYPF